MSIFTIRTGVQEGNSASEITRNGSSVHCVAGFGIKQILNTFSALVLHHGLSGVVGLGHSSTHANPFFAAMHLISSISKVPSEPPSSTFLLVSHFHP